MERNADVKVEIIRPYPDVGGNFLIEIDVARAATFFGRKTMGGPRKSITLADKAIRITLTSVSVEVIKTQARAGGCEHIIELPEPERPRISKEVR